MKLDIFIPDEIFVGDKIKTILKASWCRHGVRVGTPIHNHEQYLIYHYLIDLYSLLQSTDTGALPIQSPSHTHCIYVYS